MKTLIFALLCLSLVSCATLHHIQLGDVDARDEYVLVPFDIKVSEVGVNLQEAKSILKSTNSSGGDAGAKAAEIVSYFQMGPRTGAPIYTERYAEKIIYMIHQQCPSGKVTGLSSIRESREYPVIKGEIVKVTGYCMRPKTSYNNQSSSLQKSATPNDKKLRR